jgi:hypothetical protein
MVFFLTADIVHHLRHDGLAHAECPIPELPGKSGTLRPLLMHPFARIGFDKAQRIGNRDGGRQTDQQVNVLLHAIDGQGFAFEFSREAPR